MASDDANAAFEDHSIGQNQGMELDLGWVNSINIDTERVRETARQIPTRRSVKKEDQTKWLLAALALIDLTTLDGSDTQGKVERLCAKAKSPVRRDILAALGYENLDITTGAVCVYHAHVEEAVRFLEGTGIPVAAVSAGFPDGQTPEETALQDIEHSVDAGASEIDTVVTRELILTQNWEALYSQIQSQKEVCGDAHLKVILGVGNLGTLENVAKASVVAMMAGADFIKTSTGKESLNANLAVSLVMMRMIRDYHERTGYQVGFKPAGGISDTKTALTYLYMLEQTLGKEWFNPELFRFGASSLLGDIERQLEHRATGRYSAHNRHAMA